MADLKNLPAPTHVDIGSERYEYVPVAMGSNEYPPMRLRSGFFECRLE